MSAAKDSNRTTVVGARFTTAELNELDAQRKALGLSRAGAVKQIWQRFGDKVVEAEPDRIARDEAAAKSMQPLVDALEKLSDVIETRSFQRRAIGAHSNQVARYFNRVQQGQLAGYGVGASAIDRGVLALDRIAQLLDAQLKIEKLDEGLQHQVRTIVARELREQLDDTL